MRRGFASHTIRAMKSRSLLPIALGLVALAVAAPVAGAAKTPQITAKFFYKAEIKGVQTTTWTINHVGAGPESCDMDQTGQGKETVRFSSKPTQIYTFDGLSQPFFFMKKGANDAQQAQMPLRGTVTRSGSVYTQPLPPDADNCPDGTGEPAPPADCGTKKIKGLIVKPEYEFKKDHLVLSQSDAAKGPIFKHCPSSSSWPYLLKEDTAGRTIGQNLPYDDLFNQGKNIIIARGTYAQTTGEVQWTTRIRWELSLTRTKKEDLTRGG
jgi:hypothetical protein